MSPETFVDVFREALWLVTIMVCAVILPSLMVGLVVAIFQAAPSINEQTLSFLPSRGHPAGPGGWCPLGLAEPDGLLPADGEPDPRGGRLMPVSALATIRLPMTTSPMASVAAA